MNTAHQIVSRLLENDDVDDFMSRHVDGNVPPQQNLPKEIEVVGRYWYSRSGGSYYKTYVYVDGKNVWVSDHSSGTGSMYEQTAGDWLDHSGLIPPRPMGRAGHPPYPLWQHLQKLGIKYSRYSTDVKRERDL